MTKSNWKIPHFDHHADYYNRFERATMKRIEMLQTWIEFFVEVVNWNSLELQWRSLRHIFQFLVVFFFYTNGRLRLTMGIYSRNVSLFYRIYRYLLIIVLMIGVSGLVPAVTRRRSQLLSLFLFWFFCSLEVTIY